MEKYNFNDAEFGTHNIIANEIGIGKNVLDVGCNKGYLRNLALDNNFYGIDSDNGSLRKASENGYIEVHDVDLNNLEKLELNRKFDVIVFADILEHLLFPKQVLQFFIDNYLEDGGEIIISLPNVANISIRTRLLFGDFTYEENGILDNTHLHLYTKKTARVVIESCNLSIVKEGASSNNFGKLIKKMPFLITLLGYNLIFVCKKEF